MTSIRRLETIRGLLEQKLPDFLKAGNLQNFQTYKVDQPYTVEGDICGVVTVQWSKDMNEERYVVGLIFQISSADVNIYQYESVIVPAVPQIVTPESIGFVNLESIESTPVMNQDSNIVLIKIVVVYTKPFDNSNFYSDD